MARVKLRGSILTLAERAKSAGRQAAAAVLDEVLTKVIDEARQRWPRDTGLSASLLGVERRTDTKVAAVGKADYTTIILSKSRGLARRPWQGLVVSRIELELTRGGLAKKMAKALTARLRVRT